MDKNSWIAGNILGIYAETPGIRNLQVEISLAPKIEIDEKTIKSWRSFSALNEEDLSAVMPETQFPDSLMWIEWTTDDEFLLFWDGREKSIKEPNDLSPKKMGALIKTTKDKRSGIIQFISNGPQTLILPLAVSFDWHKEFELPEEAMKALREDLDSLGLFAENGIKLEDKYIENILKIRSKFSGFPSPYIDVSFSVAQALEPIYNSSFKYILYMEPLMIALANILECCTLETWRQTKLIVH